MKELMFKKKKEECMDPLDKEAKMAAVSEMKKMAEDAMSEKLGSLKKVTVAAPDEEGLKKGLEKAEEIVEASPEGMESEAEESEEEGSEVAEMSEEELDKKIQELLALKSKLKA
jgi:hypothetical protein